jgi:trehalose 6-phosphate phosphatase
VSLREELAQLGAAYRNGHQLALFFDYDGTLAPLVTHPAFAQCPSSTQQLLAQFARLPRVQVGIISGRALDDLKQMIHVPNLIYAGTSGLELDKDGVVTVHPRANHYRPFLEHAANSLSTIIARFGGAWIEHKSLALTVHYRNVDRDNVPFLCQCLSNALVRFDGLLTTVDGSMALEILPSVGWAKGETLRHLLEMQVVPTLSLYAGNDANDAQALKIVSEWRGVAIGIGPSAPGTALHHLPDVESLADEMLSLYAFLGG